VVLTREEIQRPLEEADDPRNCISHGTDEEVIRYLRKATCKVI
jgi:hypothetical protein